MRSIIWVAVCLVTSALAVSLLYRSVLLSAFISFFFCYFLSPVVQLLELKLRLPRVLAAGLLLFALLGLIIVLLGHIAPVIYNESVEILKLAPRALSAFRERTAPLQQFLIGQGLISEESIYEFFRDFDFFEQMIGQARLAVQQVWLTTPTVLGGVVNILLIPFLSFFILKDLRLFQEALWGFIPARFKLSVRLFLRKVDVALISVIKGQLLVAMILASLYMVGLGAIGLKFGVAIGIIAGICRIVPYLDVFVGGILSVIVIASEGLGFGMSLGVFIVFLTVQALDGVIITPRIIGERAGLHPLFVVVSILALADWFGFVGVIIAVPLLAVVKVSVSEVINLYKQSDFFVSNHAEL